MKASVVQCPALLRLAERAFDGLHDSHRALETADELTYPPMAEMIAAASSPAT